MIWYDLIRLRKIKNSKICYNHKKDEEYVVQTKFQPMLLLTVNNSIGNKKKHFTIDNLCQLFNKKQNFTNVEKYALDTINTEASTEELSWFSKDYHIPLSKIKHVLSSNFY